MDLKAWVDVNFIRVDVNFQTAIVTEFRYRFFFLETNQYQGPTNTSYKYQPNILSRSGENDDFNSFDIFSYGSHLEFSTRLHFTILEPWSLIMLHMKFKIHGRSVLREVI